MTTLRTVQDRENLHKCLREASDRIRAEFAADAADVMELYG